MKSSDFILLAVKHTYLELYMRFSAVSALNSSENGVHELSLV